MAVNFGQRALRPRGAQNPLNDGDVEMREDEREPTESQRYGINRDMKLEELLTLPGVNEGDLQKLRNVGYPTIRSVAEAPTHILESRTGFPPAKLARIQAEANRQFPVEFISCTDLHKASMDMVRISTGSTELDALLRGGVDTGSILGIFGESGSGKSQLCCTLAVKCQLEAVRGGAEGKCVFVDTVGGFKPGRIAEIAAANGLDVTAITNNVIYIVVKSLDQLFDALARVKVFLTTTRVSLLVIDSITALFRAEYEGRAMVQPRQARITKILGVLREIISISAAAVVVTIEVMDNVDGYGKGKTMCGGHVLRHGCHSLLWLRLAGKESKIAQTFKFASIPTAEVKYHIGPRGFEDHIEDRPNRRNGLDDEEY